MKKILFILLMHNLIFSLYGCNILHAKKTTDNGVNIVSIKIYKDNQIHPFTSGGRAIFYIKELKKEGCSFETPNGEDIKRVENILNHAKVSRQAIGKLENTCILAEFCFLKEGKTDTSFMAFEIGEKSCRIKNLTDKIDFNSNIPSDIQWFNSFIERVRKGSL